MAAPLPSRPLGGRRITNEMLDQYKPCWRTGDDLVPIAAPAIEWYSKTRLEHHPTYYLWNGVCCQFPCGTKPPTYVGQWGEEKQDKGGVFIKGPVQASTAWGQLFASGVKRHLSGLNEIPTGLLEYGSCLYIVMRDLGDGPYPYPHEDREWKGVTLPIYRRKEDSAARVPGRVYRLIDYLRSYQNDWSRVSSGVFDQYLTALLFRRLFLMSDTNHLNLLVKIGGKVEEDLLYSVDETICKEEHPYVWAGCPWRVRPNCFA
jgi:hypothetical protein